MCKSALSPFRSTKIPKGLMLRTTPVTTCPTTTSFICVCTAARRCESTTRPFSGSTSMNLTGKVVPMSCSSASIDKCEPGMNARRFSTLHIAPPRFTDSTKAKTVASSVCSCASRFQHCFISTRRSDSFTIPFESSEEMISNSRCSPTSTTPAAPPPTSQMDSSLSGNSAELFALISTNVPLLSSSTTVPTTRWPSEVLLSYS
mmetsp:Transcript_4333/g.11877  ORF Transcript_4333/g.11877 Transcript_4333/m.11877 type:complete len:203 (-) Transcript_4333:254-862(-)